MSNELKEKEIEILSPLPPPEWLERYNKTNPDIVKAVLDEFKNNSALNRQEIEKDNETNRMITINNLKIVRTSQWQAS
jgi:hypothetical protein